MADPISVVAGVFTMISIGIETTDTLVEFYTSHRNQDADIRQMTRHLRDLQETFAKLQTALEPHSFDSREVDLTGRIVQPCQERIMELYEECERLTNRSPNSLNGAVKFGARRITYPFRKSTLKKIDEAVGEISKILSFSLNELLVHTRLVQDETSGINSPVEPMKASTQDGSASPAQSEGVSIFSDVSAPSTNTSYLDENVEVSVLHLKEILLAQEAFDDLCQRGFGREDLAPERFANNLRRMLKNFGNALLSECRSSNLQPAAHLMLRNSRRIAALIRIRYDPSYEKVARELIASNLNSMTETDKRSRVEAFLQELNLAKTEYPKESLGTTEDSGDSGDDSETTAFCSLHDIEVFILASHAFESLIESLEGFLKVHQLEPRESLYQTSLPPMAQGPTKTAFNDPLSISQGHEKELYPSICSNSASLKAFSRSQVYEMLSKWLWRVEKPKAGLYRIQYICACGEPMLVDVNELEAWWSRKIPEAACGVTW